MSGASGSNVRILPPEGHQPALGPPRDGDRPPPRRRRPPAPGWIPLVVGAAVIVVLVIGWGLADRADDPDATVPTTLASDDARGAISEADVVEPVGAESGLELPRIVEALHTRWQAMTFDEDVRIIAIAGEAGRVVAIGEASDAPVVLVSTVGPVWNPVDTFEPPTGEVEFADLVTHGNELVAFGFVDGRLATWTASSAFDWTYGGPAAALVWVDDVVAAASDGTRIMLLGDTAVGLQAWISEEGVDWAHAGRVPIESGRSGAPAALTAHDGRFYVGGARCDGGICRPAVLRTRDGSVWRSAGSRLGPRRGVIEDTVGAVTAMATSRNGPVAAGVVLGSGGERPAIWLSNDGAEWQRAPTEAATTGSVVQLQLVATDTASPSTARIAVGDENLTLGLGEEIETSIGRLELERVEESSVTLNVAGARRQLRPGAVVRIEPDVAIKAIDAQGKRVVAVGEERFGARSLPVTWTSWDSGVTWERVVLPAEASASADAVVVDRGRMVAHGASDEGSVAWAGRWGDAMEAFLAEQQARSLLDALESSDVVRVGSAVSLSERPPGVATTLTLPGLSLADVRQQWWDESSLAVDDEGLAATLEYIDAIGWKAEISSCRSSVVFGVTERVVARCDYRTSSRLLDELGVGVVEGELVVTIDDGAMVGIESADNPTELIATWSVLMELVAQRDPTALTVAGDSTSAPLLTSRTAQLHLELAAEVAEWLLEPGEQTVGETALGRIRWTWAAEPLGRGRSIASIRAVADRIIATGWHVNGRARLWESTNGVAWRELPAPDVGWLGEVHEFNGGLLAVGQERERTGIWFFDGTAWSSVDTDVVGGSNVPLVIVATSDSAALIQAWRWPQSSPDVADVQSLRLDQDLALEPIAAPPDLDGSMLQELGAHSGGTLFISAQTSPEVAGRLWWTSDFETWEDRGVVEGLGGNEQFYRSDRGFVALEHINGAGCHSTGAARICSPATRLLLSEDGRVWEESALFETGGGPTVLGYGSAGAVGVANGWIEGGEIRSTLLSLWVSTDQSTWTRLATPLPFQPRADWVWPVGALVRDDRIVIAIETAGPSGQPATVLVGELLDR